MIKPPELTKTGPCYIKLLVILYQCKLVGMFLSLQITDKGGSGPRTNNLTSPETVFLVMCDPSMNGL